MIMHFFLFPLCSLGRIVVASEFIFSKKICIFILLKIEMVYLPLLDQTSEVHNICYSEGKKWHTNPKLDILTGSVFLSTKNASLIFHLCKQPTCLKYLYQKLVLMFSKLWSMLPLNKLCKPLRFKMSARNQFQ